MDLSPPPYPELQQTRARVQPVPDDYEKSGAIAKDFWTTEICDFPDHPRQSFREIFMEPREYKDNAVGQKLSVVNDKVFAPIFDYTQSAVFYVLSIILGIFLSLIWGLTFSINNYAIVWVVQPTVKLWFTWTRIAAVIVRASIRSMLDPLFESIGLQFSSIRAMFQLNLSGLQTFGRKLLNISSASGEAKGDIEEQCTSKDLRM